MSAMMSWLDWLGLLDLFNTPYPNRPYGSREEDFFTHLAEDLDLHREQQAKFMARQWILYHAGIQDADQGRKLWNYIDRYCDTRYPNHADAPREVFRKAIWGSCKEGGKDYNNFQPCRPPKCNWTDKEWNDCLNSINKIKGWEKQKVIINARNKLHDMNLKGPMKEFTYLAAAERLDVPYCFMWELK